MHLFKAMRMKVKTPPNGFKNTHKCKIQASNEGFYEENARISKNENEKKH